MLHTSADLRAAASYAHALADELASHCAGSFVATRIRDAVAAIATLASVPTPSNIPFPPDPAPMHVCRARAASALRAFADHPSARTFILHAKATHALDASFAAATDKLPARHLSTAPACEHQPAPCKRAPLDMIRDLHAGSYGIAKTSPGSCPHSFDSAAIASDEREQRAKQRLARLLATSKRARAMVWLIGSFRHDN